MKKSFLLFSHILILSFVYSCTPQYVSVSHKSITPIDKIETLSDSVLLSGHVPCVEVYDNYLYISDYEKGVYKVDDKGMILSTFAKRGHSKGETLGNAFLAPCGQNVMYVVDEANRRFCKYKKSEYVGEDKFPSDFMITNLTRFFVSKDTIYTSIIGDENTVVLLHNSSVVKTICPIISSVDKREYIYNSVRHIVNCDSFFCVVGESLPILQKYSYDGKLLGDLDFLSTPELLETYKKHVVEETNSSVTIIGDVCYWDGKLFLLSTIYDNNVVKSSIYVIDVTKDELKHISTLDLNDVPYSSLSVKDNGKCYLYNGRNSCIDIYELSL